MADAFNIHLIAYASVVVIIYHAHIIHYLVEDFYNPIYKNIHDLNIYFVVMDCFKDGIHFVDNHCISEMDKKHYIVYLIKSK